MKHIIYILTTILIVLLTSCSQPANVVRSPAIYGIVLDESGKPVADADVCVIPDIPKVLKLLQEKGHFQDKIQKIQSAELTKFEIIFLVTYIGLGWETASETNLDKFILERADNLTGDFSNIKAIDTLKASGNSTKVIQYTTFDKTIIPNAKYSYRLKMIDFDGSVNYSKIITMNGLALIPITLSNHPNPFTYNTYVHFSLPKSHLSKLEIIEKSTGKSSLVLDSISNAGTYKVGFEAKNTETSDSSRSIRPGVYTAKLTVDDSVFYHNMVLGFMFDSTECSIPLLVTKTDKDGQFVVQYNWFPDFQEVLKTYENGKAAGSFNYGGSANIVIRKTIESNASQKVYQLSQNKILVDKTKVVDLNCTAKKIVTK